MKRTLSSAILSLALLAPIAAAPAIASAAPVQQSVQHDRSDRNGGYRNDHNDRNWGSDDRRWRETRWGRGDRLPDNYRAHYREVDYRRAHLKAPPRGYHYVRDDRGETLLVGLATGAILGVILSR